MDYKPIKVESLKDLPEAPVSQGITLVRKTGSWKNVRPVMDERSAPCENACPLKVRIPKFIDYLTKSEPEKAGYEILKWNPFPTITGRICPAKCEIGCNRNKYDEKISIRELERFLGDLILDKKEIKVSEKKNEKVAIVGSTLSAMSVAYTLLSLGYQVELFTPSQESFEDIGQKIPRDILDKEENVLKKAGLKWNKVSDVKIEELLNKFNLIFVAQKYFGGGLNLEDAKSGRTNVEKVFSSMDDEDVSKTIKNAVNVALNMDASLQGKTYQEERLPRVVSFKEIILDYFNHEKAITEIKDLESAIKEAKRCFSCGTCNSCGNCYVFCPDSAVKWVDNFPVFDYDYCKGCGICVNECPRGVLELVPEK